MKRAVLILAALAATVTAPAAPVRTATENFVTNKIAEAIAAIPLPDYSTNNTALVETIEATAPAPGNYAVVSNAAVHAAITNALQDAAISTLSASIPTTISNIVTKEYVEDLGISSEESDPTVPQWAKAAQKPSYTADEVGATTPADVTAAIREQSLGGIWDETLRVWWTPVMRNGSLTYQATTNVNLNAEN